MSSMVHSIKSPGDISKVVDIDWTGSDRPTLVTSHSTLHICDITMKSATSSVDDWVLPEPMFCPHLLPARLSQVIKCVLQHQTWREAFSLSMTGILDHDKSSQRSVSAQLQLVDKDLTDYLPRCQFGTAHRCFLVARLFGDELEIHFWTIAMYYLRYIRALGPIKDVDKEPDAKGDRFIPPTLAHREVHDLVCFDESSDVQKMEARLFRDQPMERCYDTLCDNQSFKKYQLDRVHLQDSKRAAVEHTQKCADSYVQLGQTDRAVQLLLETEPDSDNYYIDCLKACLVASVRSSGASQSTIKLVATNLIASGRLTEGVQLLCLINKGLDACRYLQTYGAWDHAVWLAKASLEPSDCAEVLKRWAEHLSSPQVNQKSKSVLVHLSLGQFYKVLEVLYSMRNFDRAVLFLEACLEFGVLKFSESTGSLFEAIYLEYARYLINLGLCPAAEHYCHKAGDKGQQLLKEKISATDHDYHEVKVYLPTMNGLNPGKYTPISPICTEPFSSKYTVQEDIGRGKFAVVRRCVNIKTGEVVAAKIIRKRRKGKSCREEILREVVMLELAMAHPRLVCLREVFETQSELILVTEYCSGGELFDECVIKESFKEDDVRRLLAQILEGLAFLHDNNIVHLDLKPQNILLTKPFPVGEVKICDLGFACLTNTGEDIRDIIGTPDYVAPEVLDYEPLNIQTDMWSLGVLTYVMLTACSPFAGDSQQETFCNITQVKLDFPDDLFGHINPLARDFIRKLLVKRPRDRLTARQCFDHPWLKDLQDIMSLNVPLSDHSEELAHDMVIPSNWHMSPDRRSSISITDSSSIDHSSLRADVQTLLPCGLSSSSKERVLGGLSEDKDSISKTLSHIDIDRHSLDRSSTTSFETCPESMDGGQLSDTIAVEWGLSPDVSSSTRMSSTCTSDSDTVSKFASEIVQFVTTGRAQHQLDDMPPESLKVAGAFMTDISREDICEFSQKDPCASIFQPDLFIPTASNVCQVSTPRDSNRHINSKNRMSLEIPHKKAKCIEEGEGKNDESNNVHSVPLSNAEHATQETEQSQDQPRQACNGTEEYRNSV